ncbi:MAG: IS630 family transposase [Caldisericia bacterium]|nr:IS630 family transposase [Caldisericia bacterium]
MRKCGQSLILKEEQRKVLEKIVRTRTEQAVRIWRARIILEYAEKPNIYALAKKYNTNRPKVERTIHKALQFGPIEALDDLPRSGRKEVISDQARMWVCSLAVTSPLELDLPEETWTLSHLSSYIQKHCNEKGYPALKNIQKGSLSRMLKENHIQPHRIRYYMHSKDPDFDTKATNVLLTYHEVNLLKEKKALDNNNAIVSPVPFKEEEQEWTVVSYDEKPGVQITESKGITTYPAHYGKQSTIYRDPEYIRHGTLDILSGLDLVTGHIHMNIKERHRSREFVSFLSELDEYYPENIEIKIILDNHSVHTSRETRAYLKEHSGRFTFIFTPTHASWLNLIEVFFSKLQRCFLKNMRVKSKEEFIQRCNAYIEELNKEPVIFRWKYKMDKMDQYDMLFR